MPEVIYLGRTNLLRGKMILKMLKTTSVIASCARASTLEFLMSRHQSQHKNLITTVEAMIAIAGIVSCTTVWSLPVMREKPSMATWKNEVIMMTEKTCKTVSSMPIKNLITCLRLAWTLRTPVVSANEIFASPLKHIGGH